MKDFFNRVRTYLLPTRVEWIEVIEDHPIRVGDRLSIQCLVLQSLGYGLLKSIQIGSYYISYGPPILVNPFSVCPLFTSLEFQEILSDIGSEESCDFVLTFQIGRKVEKLSMLLFKYSNNKYSLSPHPNISPVRKSK